MKIIPNLSSHVSDNTIVAKSISDKLKMDGFFEEI